MVTSRSGGGGGRTGSINLLLSSDPSSASGGGELVDFPVQEGEADMGVDLGAVGRALGLEPATVTLNGFLLGSSGPHHVAASVTWRSLLAFFSARGLPAGTYGDYPIVVRGKKPSPSLSGHRSVPGPRYQSDWGSGGRKRKLRLEDENPLKKKKLVRCNPSASEDGDDSITDSALCIKNKLKLDDDNPCTKREKTEDNSGSHHETSMLSSCKPHGGSTCSYIIGHQKRSREEEMVLMVPSCIQMRFWSWLVGRRLLGSPPYQLGG